MDGPKSLNEVQSSPWSGCIVLCVLKSAHALCCLMTSSDANDTYSINTVVLNGYMLSSYKVFRCRYGQVTYKLHSNTEAKCGGKHLKFQQLGSEGGMSGAPAWVT